MTEKGYYCGMRVIVTEGCETLVPKHKHKKWRVQKKWVKRYGETFKPCTTLIGARLIDGNYILLCHPKYWDKYKKILELEGVKYEKTTM